MNLQYLIKYKSFTTVSEMDAAVKEHSQTHGDQLTESAKSVLHCLAKHSLTAVGACHLKTETIAKEIGVSTQTVYRATKKLTELGIITKQKTVKRTGQGASIYVIAPKINTSNVSHSMSDSCQSLETHVKPVTARDSHGNLNTVTSFSTSSFNQFGKCVVNNVNAHSMAPNVREVLKSIYSPQSVEGKRAFEELCQIAFGRLKQYVKSHKIPYLQMIEIITNCMRQLVAKQNVRNQFAMYSAMIKRQVEQLFEQPVQVQRNKELVPDWFDKRNEAVMPSAVNAEVDFEAERAKVLAKLQGAV